MTRVWGAKQLGLKMEAKRLGAKRLGGKRLGGETSCYRIYWIIASHFREILFWEYKIFRNNLCLKIVVDYTPGVV